MDHKVTDEDFMIHLLGFLPKEYKNKVESLENDMDHSYNPLKVERKTNKLNMKYKKI